MKNATDQRLGEESFKLILRLKGALLSGAHRRRKVMLIDGPLKGADQLLWAHRAGQSLAILFKSILPY